jgi:malonyl CoA-acyl carrier protein transacylase
MDEDIPLMKDHTAEVLSEVMQERARQDAKWGEQNHPDGTGGQFFKYVAKITREACDAQSASGQITWRHILDEEAAEVCAETDPAKLREELVQVAAVAVAWIEAIDRRSKT